jgi:hypothetical protein
VSAATGAAAPAVPGGGAVSVARCVDVLGTAATAAPAMTSAVGNGAVVVGAGAENLSMARSAAGSPRTNGAPVAEAT